jgi:hypothetical protein
MRGMEVEHLAETWPALIAEVKQAQKAQQA